MKHRKFIPGFLVFAAALAGRILLEVNKTEIFVRSGVGTFRTLVWCARASMVVGLLAFAIPLFGVLSRRRADRKATELIRKAKAEQRRNAPLASQSGRFKEEDVRNYLSELLASAPPKLTLYLEEFQARLDKMNMYQSRLNNLLIQNGADDMTEPVVFLDKLEQFIFGVMRKVFNWITMYDESVPDSEIQQNLDRAKTSIDTALEQASDLCRAITNYINGQGNRVDITNQIEQYIQIMKEETTQ